MSYTLTVNIHLKEVVLEFLSVGIFPSRHINRVTHLEYSTAVVEFEISRNFLACELRDVIDFDVLFFFDKLNEISSLRQNRPA